MPAATETIDGIRRLVADAAERGVPPDEIRSVVSRAVREVVSIPVIAVISAGIGFDGWRSC